MPLAKSGRAAARARADRDAAALDRGGRRVGAALGLHPARAHRSRPPRASRGGRGTRSTRSCSPGSRRRASPRRRRPRDRATLLRRLSFDLIGLPPTPEEVARLRSRHAAQDAYERQVDRLLASPHFGERMALFWLDLVRYSDSVGYHSDNARPMWRYRDWVVAAWNANLPFDRFTAEQLAGDLLARARRDADSDRVRLQPAAADDRGGRRAAEGVPRDLPRRPRAQRLERLAGRDARLRPVPRPQVRPVPARATSTPSSAFFADVNETPVGRRKPDLLPDAAQKAGARRARREGEGALKSRARGGGAHAGVGEGARGAACRDVHDARARARDLGERHARADPGQRLLDHRLDLQRTEACHGHLHASASRPSSSGSRRCGSRRRPSRSSRAADRDATRGRLRRLGARGPRRGRTAARAPERDGLDARRRRLRPPRRRSTATRRTAAGRSRTADGESHRLVVELAAPVLREGETTTLTLVVHQNAGGRARSAGCASRAASDALPGPHRRRASSPGRT